jgi:putative DNA primase/helicase
MGRGEMAKPAFRKSSTNYSVTIPATADASLLLIKKSDGPRNDVARLEGKRLVFTSEIEAGSRLAEGLVKLLTGGDKVCARRLYCEHEEFDSTFKIWIRTNSKPEIRGLDNAIWKRLRLIPFDVTIPDEEQDKTLTEKLQAELSGILAWAIRGCLEWQQNGLGAPPEVIAATESYKKESDVLGEFLEDCCELAKEREIPFNELYKAYRNYCLQNGMPDKQIIHSATFGKMLTDRGIGTRRDKQHRYRTGIDLKKELTEVMTVGVKTGVSQDAVPDLAELAGKL